MSTTPLNGLEVFLAIAEQGSLRRAATEIGVQAPAISYQLKSLERRIGTPLFIRTTRSIELTDAGRALLARSKPAMRELAEALEDARSSGGARKGTIKITLPYHAYSITIANKLADFHALYPDIELDLSFNEAFVDIVSEGFHAGVRSGELIHGDMIAARLSPPIKETYFAAPIYLEKRGRPKHPRDLLQHNCIRYRYIASNRIAEWEFRGPEGDISISVSGNLVVNSTSALINATKAGLGITWLFHPNVENDLNSGDLESVLDSYAIERPGHFLYYPKANARIEVLRVFIDFMRV